MVGSDTQGGIEGVLEVVPEVDLHTFAAAQEGGAFVLDVREPFEYAVGHVPGAQLMPMAQVHSRLAELPRSGRVYVICAAGNRSFTAAGWLRNAGIDALSVAGGTGDWAAHGRPLAHGAGNDNFAA